MTKYSNINDIFFQILRSLQIKIKHIWFIEIPENIHRVSQSNVKCLSEQNINAISSCNEQNTLAEFSFPVIVVQFDKKGRPNFWKINKQKLVIFQNV